MSTIFLFLLFFFNAYKVLYNNAHKFHYIIIISGYYIFRSTKGELFDYLTQVVTLSEKRTRYLLLLSSMILNYLLSKQFSASWHLILLRLWFVGGTQ